MFVYENNETHTLVVLSHKNIECNFCFNYSSMLGRDHHLLKSCMQNIFLLLLAPQLPEARTESGWHRDDTEQLQHSSGSLS